MIFCVEKKKKKTTQQPNVDGDFCLPAPQTVVELLLIWQYRPKPTLQYDTDP